MSSKAKEKKIRELVSQSTNEVMESHTLEEAVRQAIQSGDEESLSLFAMNAAMTSCYEYSLATDQILMERMGFSEAQIDAFHENMRDMLVALAEVHSYGNNPMSLEDMQSVGEIAKAKYPEEKRLVMMKKLGLAVPQNDGSSLILQDPDLENEVIPSVKKKKRVIH